MHASRVLEFEAIVYRLRDQCQTALGAALAELLQPSFVEDDVWRTLAQTAEGYLLVGQATLPSLGPVRDHRDALKRAQKGGVLTGQELFSVADALAAMRALRSVLIGRREDCPNLWPYADLLPELKRLEDTLFESLDPSGDVKDSASTALANLRQRKQSTTTRIVERIQSYVSGKSRELLSDPLYTVRDGRYVIPLKSENRGKIRGIVHDTSGSGLTLYVEPEDVLQLGNALREIEAAEREVVLKILGGLSAKVGGVAAEIITGIEASGQLDLVFAKAKLAYSMRGSQPQRLKSHRIQIQGGKHPLLDPEAVVPLDLEVGVGGNVLITGPNTGGKTVAIKTVGLFVLMAQSGLYPPALDVRLGPFTQVWADIGDEQSLQQSLSTFSGHIKNIAEALKDLKPGALVLFDEIGAGTDPAEGAALAKAILSAIAGRGAAILASTHYGELKQYAYETEGFQNAAMEFDQKSLRPTYRLLLGAAGASQALRIAERYGIPKDVVDAARSGLSTQHQDVARMMEQLDQAQKLARQAQGEADRRAAELKRMEERTAKKLEEAEEVRRTAHSKANAVIEEALREIRLEAAAIFDELKKAGVGTKAQEAARGKLRDLQEVGADFAQSFKQPERRKEPPAGLKKGMTVKIDGYTQTGVLLDEPSWKNVAVQVGRLKMTVPLTSLSPAKPADEPRKARVNPGLQRAQTARTEIHLRAMRAEEAENDLERFVDDAVLAGLPSVRIVHGKGEGILRQVTREFLRRHPDVKSFRDGEPAEGGHGVTIAVFR